MNEMTTFIVKWNAFSCDIRCLRLRFNVLLWFFGVFDTLFVIRHGFPFRMNGQCTSAEWFVFFRCHQRETDNSIFLLSCIKIFTYARRDLVTVLLFMLILFMSSGLCLRSTRLSIVKWKDTFLCFATKERHQNNSFYMCKNKCSTTNKRLTGLTV